MRCGRRAELRLTADVAFEIRCPSYRRTAEQRDQPHAAISSSSSVVKLRLLLRQCAASQHQRRLLLLPLRPDQQVTHHLVTSFVSLTKFLCNRRCSVRSHTRTVVREYFKGDEASQWKRPKFDPSPHRNPLTDLHKNWQA